MSQHYSDPKRADDPGALPDVETFYVGYAAKWDAPLDCFRCSNWTETNPTPHSEHVGWYWQSCFPGCLPDGEPNGPFVTEQEALDDARSGVGDVEEDSDDGGDDEPEDSAELPADDNANGAASEAEPFLEIVYATLHAALEQAIAAVCDEDVQNRISDAYRRIIAEWRRDSGHGEETNERNN